MIFCESPAFSRVPPEILSDDEYFTLQDLLMERPHAGDLIPGSSGLRKIRVGSGGKGKRGGARVIYYWYVTPEKIQFCRIYAKSSQTDLSKEELKQIRKELEP